MLLLISVKFELLVSSDMLTKSLFTKFLFVFFFSFCGYFNAFLGLTVSDISIVTGFSADLDQGWD